MIIYLNGAACCALTFAFARKAARKRMECLRLG